MRSPRINLKCFADIKVQTGRAAAVHADASIQPDGVIHRYVDPLFQVQHIAQTAADGKMEIVDMVE